MIRDEDILKTPITRASLTAAAAALMSTALASASAGPVGEWRTADGTTTVAIRPCGHYLCGFIASTTTPQDPTIGRQIFYNMQPRGEQWSGTIVDIVVGQRYSGHISLIGEGTLKVEGCLIGGVLCGSENWRRVR